MPLNKVPPDLAEPWLPLVLSSLFREMIHYRLFSLMISAPFSFVVSNYKC